MSSYVDNTLLHDEKARQNLLFHIAIGMRLLNSNLFFTVVPVAIGSDLNPCISATAVPRRQRTRLSKSTATTSVFGLVRMIPVRMNALKSLGMMQNTTRDARSRLFAIQRVSAVLHHLPSQTIPSSKPAHIALLVPTIPASQMWSRSSGIPQINAWDCLY
jgi:hypothetical protein